MSHGLAGYALPPCARHRPRDPGPLRGETRRHLILVVDGDALTEVSAPPDVTHVVKGGEVVVRPTAGRSLPPDRPSGSCVPSSLLDFEPAVLDGVAECGQVPVDDVLDDGRVDRDVLVDHDVDHIREPFVRRTTQAAPHRRTR